MAKILLDDVSWKYGNDEAWALKNVNLEIQEGEMVLITGPTGAGKSTLCRLINGLIPHGYPGILRGRVYVNGIDTTTLSISKLSGQVGSVFEDAESQIIWTNVKDEIIFVLENRRIPKDEIEERLSFSLSLLGLSDKIEKTPYELSGGQKQRLAIASVIAARPSIIVLDEPTSQLDPVGRREVMEAIRKIRDEYNSTIVIVEHNIEALVKYVDKMVLLNNGELITQGRPESFYSSAEKIIQNRGPMPECVELSYKLSQLTSEGTLCFDVDCLKNKIESILHNKLITNGFKRMADFANNHFDEELEEMISAESISYQYQDGTKALQDISFRVKKGEMIGIIGVNGSGKTTLAKSINGLIKPSSGILKVMGKRTDDYEPIELVKRVGYVFQNPIHQISCRTVKDEIAFGMRNLRFDEKLIKERIKELLERFNLTKFENTHPYNLSRADQFRVTFASVIAMEPNIIIVDEPTTGQDYAQSHEIMNFLQNENKSGKTVLVITHHLRFIAQYTPRLLMLTSGRLVYDGETRKAFNNPELMKASQIDPPEISKLVSMLSDRGFSELLTVDEIVDRLFEIASL